MSSLSILIFQVVRFSKILLRLISGCGLERMAEKAAKAEISLAKTCRRLGITQEGKNWLDLALDPFKDLNMPVNGFPDDVETPSVVETIHDSFVVTVPATVAAGNNWDANIFVDQLYNLEPMYLTGVSQDNIFGLTGQTLQGSRGGIQVRSGPANSQLNQTTAAAGLGLKSDVLPNADIRLVGIGLEIHNTTQELKKQGAIVCYRIPTSTNSTGVATVVLDYTGNVASTPAAYPLVELAQPPSSASQAIDLPGSLQWEAKDGAYIVPTLTEPIIPVEEQKRMGIKFYDSDVVGTYFNQILQYGTAKQMYIANKNLMSPFSLSGCFLSGLSYETSLQVNLTYYVEIFPDKTNLLRRLAKPSPASDAQAMALYGHIVDSLPVGCQVSDNFIGAFIAGVSRIAQTAIRVLPQVGRAINTGFQVVNALNDGFKGMDMERSNNPLGGSLTGPVQNSNRPPHLNTQLIPRQEVRRNELAMIPYVETRKVTTDTIRSNQSVHMNNGLTEKKSQRAAKRHRKALAEAANKPNTRNGNRWIENHK